MNAKTTDSKIEAIYKKGLKELDKAYEASKKSVARYPMDDYWPIKMPKVRKAERP